MSRIGRMPVVIPAGVTVTIGEDKKAQLSVDSTKYGDAADKLYTVIQQQRRDILAHREALGLTPKAFKRLRPMDSGAAADSEPVGGANRQLAGLLDRLMEGAHGDA